MKYASNAKQLSRVVVPYYVDNHVGEILSFPKMITITTTRNCNYRCKMCYQKDYGKEEIDWAYMDSLEGALPFVQRLQIFGGEPLLYSRFDDIVTMGMRHDVKMVTITNGSLLNRERARHLVDSGFYNVKVSFDAGTPKTYKQIRGGNYHKVLGNIAEVAKLKAQRNSDFPILEMQMVAMRSNIHELGKLLGIASIIGVDRVNVFYLVTSDESLADESLFFHQEYSDEQMLMGSEMSRGLGVGLSLPKLFGTEQAKQGRTFEKCKDPWEMMLINVNGEVSPCCGGAPSMGSLEGKDFMDVWNGAKYANLRETVNTSSQPEYCNKCFGRMQDHRSISAHINNPKLVAKLLAVKGMPQENAA